MTVLTHNYIRSNAILENGNFGKIDSLMEIFPVQNIRVTVIDPEGKVLYDSEVVDYGGMENHLQQGKTQHSVCQRIRYRISQKRSSLLS